MPILEGRRVQSEADWLPLRRHGAGGRRRSRPSPRRPARCCSRAVHSISHSCSPEGASAVVIALLLQYQKKWYRCNSLLSAAHAFAALYYVGAPANSIDNACHCNYRPPAEFD
eukprot:COSAG01_NODE_4879_length_4656_cov_5.636384_9_plen_113_part_00